MLAAACSLNRSLLATNVYNLMFMYHICIGKINELVLSVLLCIFVLLNGLWRSLSMLHVWLV